MEPDFDFGEALKRLKEGKSVARRGWGQHLTLQVPDENSKMSLPYIYIQTVQAKLVPWLASQTDLLANDWCEIEFHSGAEGPVASFASCAPA